MCTADDPTKRMTDFLILRMSQMHSNHDHKENMAHAAVVVTLGLAGAMVSAESWPPKWIEELCISGKAMALVGVVIPWLFIHVYMRWQLRNRRAAAIYVASFLKVLRNWAITPPTAEDLKPCDKDPSKVNKVDFLIDFLIPWNRSNVTADEGIKGYPTALVKELERNSTGAIKGEAIVTFGSLLLGLLIVVRALV
jgi:hypothetical protein